MIYRRVTTVSQAYTMKIKNYSNICSPSYDSQISSNESSSDEEYSHFHDKKGHFLTTNIRKGKYNSHQSHQRYKTLTSPVKRPTSPMRENISSVKKQRKSPVRELSLSPVKEDQSPVRAHLKQVRNDKARVMTRKKEKDDAK